MFIYSLHLGGCWRLTYILYTLNSLDLYPQAPHNLWLILFANFRSCACLARVWSSASCWAHFCWSFGSFMEGRTPWCFYNKADLQVSVGYSIGVLTAFVDCKARLWPTTDYNLDPSTADSYPSPVMFFNCVYSPACWNSDIPNSPRNYNTTNPKTGMITLIHWPLTYSSIINNYNHL